ncbi:MAG: ribosomal L7Ae/L30e/S12e/Gadd45 family protein [Clostridia bacterium]|nr:ribosomal L7Ae/L30e/S12e/Gadd45 family protein [Clostridia bacterium]
MSEDRIYGFLGIARKAGALALGESVAEQAVRRGKAHLVLVTLDASDNTKKKIETACFTHKVPMVAFGEKEKLGHMLGKAFFSVLAVTDKGFSDRIHELIEQNSNNNTAHGGGFN